MYMMKKTLRFIFLEIGFLRRTIIIIGLILAVFSAAFLSVVSVMFDVQKGLCDLIDDHWAKPQCLISDVALKDTETYGGNFTYGEVVGLTTQTELTVKDVDGVFPTEQTLVYGETETQANYYGFAVGKDSSALFELYNSFLTAGHWIDGPNQIVLSTNVYSADLNGCFSRDVTLGDTVVIDGKQFEVVGLYSLIKGRTSMYGLFTSPKNNAYIRSAYFYLSVDEDQIISVAHVSCQDASQLDSVYKSFSRKKYEVNTAGISISNSNYGEGQVLENLDLANAFFLAVAFVLGIIIVFILYSLMSIFYRQRKSNICRMKLLGARNSLVTMTYTIIAIGLVLLAVLIGSVLSIAFNNYYINLCKEVFGYENFVSHFYPVIPISLFFALTACIFVIYGRIYRRIRNAALAQEVRNE